MWIDSWFVIESKLGGMQVFSGREELSDLGLLINLHRKSTSLTSVLCKYKMRYADSMSQILRVMRGVHKELIRDP